MEEAVRARLAAELGGLRGSLETAVPVVAFTVAYVIVGGLRVAIVAGVTTALAVVGVRVVQRSETRFARNGLIGMVVAAVVASVTGRAEDAFLPGILQSGLWGLVLGGSLLLRRPAGGYVVGAVLGDPGSWRQNPAIARLGARLTLVLLAPMVIRLAVQLPLYLAGAVGWLGLARLLLGWPLHAATLAVAGAVLIRGHTPLDEAKPGRGTTW